MKTLEQLIDEAMSSGAWYGINIFADRGEGARAHLLLNISTARCDQIADPAVPASARLRTILEANLQPSDQPDLFDDLLG